MLRADDFALRFATLHLAAVRVEALATSGACRLIAYWAALLVAHRGIARPRAHGRAIFGLALLLHTRAPLLPATIAVKMSTVALRSGLPHSGRGHWQVIFDFIFDFLLNLLSARLHLIFGGFAEIASLQEDRGKKESACTQSNTLKLHCYN
jgi:hypothetical protein